jgi:hypothetical protein
MLRPLQTRVALPQTAIMEVLRNIVVERVGKKIKHRLKTLGCQQYVMGATGGIKH